MGAANFLCGAHNTDADGFRADVATHAPCMGEQQIRQIRYIITMHHGNRYMQHTLSLGIRNTPCMRNIEAMQCDALTKISFQKSLQDLHIQLPWKFCVLLVSSL